MRKFERCRDVKTGELLYPDARMPVYSTRTAVGADIFAADTVVIPSHEMRLVHTGIKVCFPDDETFMLVNRSGNPNQGLVLANGVGIFESDYYENPTNDGEILFNFYNITDGNIVVEKGKKIGQGVFYKICRASNIDVHDVERQGGFGSTGTV